MTLLVVPLALLVLVGFLVLAAHLEHSEARLLVRLTFLSDASPEVTEAIIAAELAPLLAAEGLTDRR